MIETSNTLSIELGLTSLAVKLTGPSVFELVLNEKLVNFKTQYTDWKLIPSTFIDLIKRLDKRDLFLTNFYTELILTEGQTRDGNNSIYEAYMPYSSISKAYKLIFKLDTRSQVLQTLGDNFPIYWRSYNHGNSYDF